MEQSDHIRKRQIYDNYATVNRNILTPRLLTLPRQLKFFTEEKLEILLEKRLSLRKQKRAAIMIQKHFCGFKYRMLYQREIRLRLEAAIRIQRTWRSLSWARLFPKLRQGRLRNSAVTIQKYLRGYLVGKRSFKEVINCKLQIMTDYFKGMRADFINDMQTLIAYHWRKYIKQKKVKIERLRLKKLKQQENKSKKKSTVKVMA